VLSLRSGTPTRSSGRLRAFGFGATRSSGRCRTYGLVTHKEPLLCGALDGIDPPVRWYRRSMALGLYRGMIREGFANQESFDSRSSDYSIESPHDLGCGGEEKLLIEVTESTQSGQTHLMRIKKVGLSMLLGNAFSSSGLLEESWTQGCLQPSAKNGVLWWRRTILVGLHTDDKFRLDRTP